MWPELTETSTSQANNSLLSTFSNESFGLTANVRKSGDVFELIVVVAISGEEVLSTHRPTQKEAEKFAFGLMNPSHDPSAIGLRAGSRASFAVPETWIKGRRRRGEYH
jgi:hypothetical protein